MSHLHAIEQSIHYLNSDQARETLSVDIYWPKWTAPWWHIALLYEMGLTDRIPRAIVQHMAACLKAQFLPYFFASELPEGKSPIFNAPCPCQLGNMYQVLSAAGIDMDQELPWARSWFLRYQMPDGGLSCDEDAYKNDPPASSVVGTIAPLEAILFHTHRPFTAEEETFLDKGAQCLVRRKLMLGCSVEYNADERLDESDWIKLCFPRFYLYDILRGLNFILSWSEKREKPLPLASIQEALEVLENKFPDGAVRIERHAYEGVGTRFHADGDWQSVKEAYFHPLLQEVSKTGEVSPYLSAQWSDVKAKLSRLKAKSLIR